MLRTLVYYIQFNIVSCFVHCRRHPPNDRSFVDIDWYYLGIVVHWNFRMFWSFSQFLHAQDCSEELIVVDFDCRLGHFDSFVSNCIAFPFEHWMDGSDALWADYCVAKFVVFSVPLCTDEHNDWNHHKCDSPYNCLALVDWNFCSVFLLLLTFFFFFFPCWGVFPVRVS